MWDATINNGNMFWSPTIRTFDFFQGSDEQRIEKFQDHPILLSFKERYSDLEITQELKYSGKFQYYTHTNGTFTAQLKIWDAGSHASFFLSCSDTKTGLDNEQKFIKDASQINYQKCR